MQNVLKLLHQVFFFNKSTLLCHKLNNKQNNSSTVLIKQGLLRYKLPMQNKGPGGHSVFASTVNTFFVLLVELF